MMHVARRALPLTALAGSAGAVYLATILARRTFTEAEFVDWAYIMSLTSFFFSFSLLGSEQLVVRTAREKGARLLVPRGAARLIAASLVAFILVYVFALDGRLFAYRMGIVSVPVLGSIGAIQVVYQYERARGQLLAAQVAFGTWKYALPALVLIVPAASGRAEWAVTGALVSGFIVSCAVARGARSSFALVDQGTDATRVFLPFMLSLGTIAVLNLADRFVLEKVHGAEQFAAYVYLATLVTTPFNILSGYFGFKEAVRYRRSYSRKAARQDALRNMGLTAVLVVAWSTLCFAARGPLSLPFDAPMWALLGALSIVRCGYSVLSAAMGVRGSPKAIYVANAASILAIAAFGALAIAASAPVQYVVAGYVAVWSVRWISYFWLLDPTGPDARERPDVGDREGSRAGVELVSRSQYSI